MGLRACSGICRPAIHFPDFKCVRGSANNLASASAVWIAPVSEASAARVTSAWASIVQFLADSTSDAALVDKTLMRLTGHALRHYLPNWAARFLWSLPAREELGRWAGDILLLAGEERDTKQRAARAICAVRYASSASRETQLRLAFDLYDAIAGVLPDDDTMWSRIENSAFYRRH